MRATPAQPASLTRQLSRRDRTYLFALRRSLARRCTLIAYSCNRVERRRVLMQAARMPCSSSPNMKTTLLPPAPAAAESSTAPNDHLARHPELRDAMMRHAPTDGAHATALAGLRLYRYSQVAQKFTALYESSMCLIVQGRKRVLIGTHALTYEPMRYLVASQDLPCSSEILNASPEEPYLCVQLAFQPRDVAAVMLDMGRPADPPATSPARGLYTEETTPALLDVTLRLLRLLDTPGDVEALGGSVRREILYRLLTAPNGWRLARCATPDSYDQRISRVISYVRERYREPLRIADLARAGHMSESSLHQRFKAVTALTPLQYQKQLRLQEARRLLMGEGVDAASAAFGVGYQSASQFSREYARLFGEPPQRDRARLFGLAR
jgi:AraC-like DNA-binding protein